MNTKDLILSTAKDMISEVGFHRMTTANLARRAAISEGTIYRHFASKEDILQNILDAFDTSYRTLAEQCRERMARDDLSIDDLLGSHFAFLEANASDIKIVLGTYTIIEATKHSMDRFAKSAWSLFRDFLEHGGRRGELREVPLDTSAMILTNIFFGLMRVKLYWPELQDCSADAIAFCRRSLVPDWEKRA